ncbi:MAG: DUF6252 family protein [Bacteroidota bacterium]
MKNLFLYFVAVLFVAGSLSSCEKDSSPTGESPEEQGAHFSVMLNGNPYVVEDEFRAYAYDLDNQITINGVGDLDANESVVVGLPQGFTTGTYTMVPAGDTYAVAIIDGIAYNTQLTGSNGEVTITKNDGVNMEGTFQFVAKGGDQLQHTLEATEGEFQVKLRD